MNKHSAGNQQEGAAAHLGRRCGLALFGLRLTPEGGLNAVFLVFAKDFGPLRNGARRKPASLGRCRDTAAKGFDCLLFGHHGAMLAGLQHNVNSLTS